MCNFCYSGFSKWVGPGGSMDLGRFGGGGDRAGRRGEEDLPSEIDERG